MFAFTSKLNQTSKTKKFIKPYTPIQILKYFGLIAQLRWSFVSIVLYKQTKETILSFLTRTPSKQHNGQIKHLGLLQMGH